MKLTLIALAVTLGSAFGAAAQTAPQQSNEQICQAKANELHITDAMRETYMRECLAGERLSRGEASAK